MLRVRASWCSSRHRQFRYLVGHEDTGIDPGVTHPTYSEERETYFHSFEPIGIATRSKKLLVAPGITTRNKDATSGKDATSSKGHRLDRFKNLEHLGFLVGFVRRSFGARMARTAGTQLHENNSGFHQQTYAS